MLDNIGHLFVLAVELYSLIVFQTLKVEQRGLPALKDDGNHAACRCVVRFVRCFEDTENIYILLELCSNQVNYQLAASITHVG